MADPTHVRVRMASGTHVSVPAEYAEGIEGLHVLKQEAIDERGRVLPPQRKESSTKTAGAKSPEEAS